MEGLFNPTSILLHMLNAAILLVALYFLLYKPVRGFMEKRRQGVEDELCQVQKQRDLLKKEKEQAAQAAQDAQKQAADALKRGEKLQKEQARRLIAKAQEEASDILQKARAEAAQMREDALCDMRDEVTDLSVAISEKLLAREVNAADHDKLIDDFLKKVQPDGTQDA